MTTLTATYPLIVHPEVLTHRDRERNAASNRAIPFEKMLKSVLDDPFVPVRFGREQSGMQMGEDIPEYLACHARAIWNESLQMMARQADRLHNIGRDYQEMVRESSDGNLDIQIKSHADIKIHKSLPNRLLVPWQWITVVMTATEWKNLFRLRIHKDAEIHIRIVVEMMRDAIAGSTPKLLQPGEWHRPFVRDVDENELLAKFTPEDVNAVSTARVARVSYMSHENKIDVPKDFARFEKLVAGSGFGHWSPHGHVAQCSDDPDVRSGPFRGWNQFRKQFANENVEG